MLHVKFENCRSSGFIVDIPITVLLFMDDG